MRDVVVVAYVRQYVYVRATCGNVAPAARLVKPVPVVKPPYDAKRIVYCRLIRDAYGLVRAAERRQVGRATVAHV